MYTRPIETMHVGKCTVVIILVIINFVILEACAFLALSICVPRIEQLVFINVIYSDIEATKFSNNLD